MYLRSEPGLMNCCPFQQCQHSNFTRTNICNGLSCGGTLLKVDESVSFARYLFPLSKDIYLCVRIFSRCMQLVETRTSIKQIFLRLFPPTAVVNVSNRCKNRPFLLTDLSILVFQKCATILVK